MKTGWTGGQYSLIRVLLALAIAATLSDRWTSPGTSLSVAGLLSAGLVACVALAFGWRDRIAAYVLLALLIGVVAFIDGAPLTLPRADALVGMCLLGLHLSTPPDPYGAWSARGRPNPAGAWAMPKRIPRTVFALLAAIYVFMDVARILGIAFSSGGIQPSAIDASRVAWLGLIFDFWFAAGVFRVRWRPSAWIAMSIWRLAWLFAFGGSSAEASLWLMQLFAFDPAWLPGRAGHQGAGRGRLFYDGSCGLCHRSVRFLLAEDIHSPETLRLDFAPLEGAAFATLLESQPDLAADELPDSIVLEVEDGKLLTRAGAATEIATRLGGLWRAIAFVVTLGGFLPTGVLNAVYDFIARHRRRFFDQPKESCPIIPPEMRARFEI